MNTESIKKTPDSVKVEEKEESWTAKDYAEAFLQYDGTLNRYTTIVKTIKDTEEMYIYNPKLGYYTKDANHWIGAFLTNYKVFTKRLLGDVVSYIKNRTWIERKNFSSPNNLLATINCVVDISTGECKPHSQNYNFTGRLEIEYNKNAPTPINFLEFIGHIPEKDVILIQEMFGYTLLNTIAKYGFFIQGTGDSGKTTLMRILTLLLGGKENISAFSMDTLTNPESKSIAYLNGKRANIDSDTEYNYIKNIAPFKKLTGQDPISADRKHEHFFQFYNKAKIIIIGNKLPNLSKEVYDDKQFWNRVILIKLKNKITIPEDKIERDMETALIKYYIPELPGILNWSIEGAKRYIKNNHFTYDHDTTFDRWSEEEEEDETIKDFINKTFSFSDSESGTNVDVVYMMYYMYSKKNNVPDILCKRDFSIAMHGMNIKTKRESTGKRGYIYKGLSQYKTYNINL